MRTAIFALLLLFATVAVAQQQTPPGSTPPTFPSDTDKAPGNTAPPDHPAPPDANAPPAQPMPPDRNAQPMATDEIQQQIQKKLDTEPDLNGANVKAEVSDTTVILTGSVASEQEHDLALRIAHSYSGDRTIDDKIQVKARS
jgi:hyperosmotically inducible periplasmic protein